MGDGRSRLNIKNRRILINVAEEENLMEYPTAWETEQAELIEMDPLSIKVRLINIGHDFLQSPRNRRARAEFLENEGDEERKLFALYLDDMKYRVEVGFRRNGNHQAEIMTRIHEFPNRRLPRKLLRLYLGSTLFGLCVLVAGRLVKDPWYLYNIFEVFLLMYLIVGTWFMVRTHSLLNHSTPATREALEAAREEIATHFAGPGRAHIIDKVTLA